MPDNIKAMLSLIDEGALRATMTLLGVATVLRLCFVGVLSEYETITKLKEHAAKQRLLLRAWRASKHTPEHHEHKRR